MNSKSIANGIIRAILSLGALYLLFIFLDQISSVIIYITIAGVVTLIGMPIVDFLKNKLKFPNTLAVITTMLLFTGILFSIIALFIPLILEQGSNLALLNTDQFKTSIERIVSELNAFFQNRTVNIVNELKSFDFSKSLKAIPNFFNSIINALGSFSIGVFSVLFIAFFFMKDKKSISKAVFVLVPEQDTTKARNSLTRIKSLISRYFLGLIAQISILFAIYSTALLVNDVENPIVIAFLCALLNIIPYLGPLIGGFLIILLTMSGNLGQDFSTVILPTAGYVLLWYIFAQLVDNFLSQPLIFSKSVKSHPLEIFLIISIGGLVFGIAGMVLAIPAYTVIKVVLKEFFPDNKIVQFVTKGI